MTKQTTRLEHLAWCKKRALEYLPDDPAQAVASMSSDIRKHPEGMQGNTLAAITMIGMFEIEKGANAVRRWIEGFN